MGSLALAHLVLLASNGRVNGVLLGTLMRMLLLLLLLLHGLGHAGLASAGSKQVLS